jgi:tricorn protease
MKRAFPFIVFVLCFAAAAPGPAFAAGRNGYYRFPAVHGATVVFTSEGDLWAVGIDGGAAVRLTTHPGQETNPAISPDGTTVAFSAQYEGPTEVYTMPLAGGLPVRHTFSGQTSTVVGWTPDGKILYATQKYSTLPSTELVVLDPKNDAETLLPLSQAADGSFDPAGRTLYFTRLPFQGSYTKRYKGGTAQNIWKYEAESAEAVPLTADYPGTSKNPMFWRGRLYFVSDRDGTMNIWSMDTAGRDLKQHTFHKGFDASSPALDGGRIVYQLVADLHVFDIAGAEDRKIDVTLSSDFDQMREKWVAKPLDYLTSADVSPAGDRVALVSRGNVFVAPVGDGRWVRVSRKDGVRHLAARFMPDGKSLMVISDETGEWEFHRFPADGLGNGETLTTGSKVIRFDGVPSPDGRWIAFADKNFDLWLFNLEKKSLNRILASPNGMPDDIAWSPDSQWLTFVRPADNDFSQIMLFQPATGRLTELTDDRVDSYGPAWAPDGNWLYFLSDRYFRSAVGSPWGPRQPEPYFDKTTKIYAMALKAGLVFPFAPANELTREDKGKNAGEENPPASPGAKREKPTEVKDVKPFSPPRLAIELEGLQDRVFEVPLPAGAY